jgi:TPR repeat protein
MRNRLPSSLLLCLLLNPVAFTQTPTLGLNAPQLYEKGMNNLMGVDVSRNDLNAVDYLRRSAELGYPPAQVATEFRETSVRRSHGCRNPRGRGIPWTTVAGADPDGNK